MNARRIALAALAITGLAAGYYFFLYLTRWEWNRALVSGVIFLAAEIGLIGALVLERLARLRREVREIAAPGQEPRPEILSRIEEAEPESRDPFAWLSPKHGRTSVFIPVLLGAGVIASSIAWVVERIARAAAGPTVARSLALELEAIALPDEPLYAPTSRRLGLFGPAGR